MGSKQLVSNLQRITSSQTIIAGNWHSLDLFLVGGGGSGGGWVNWGYGPGGGGAGGECVTQKGIRVSKGSRITIVIGKGGDRVAYNSGTAGNKGGETKVTFSDTGETYIARGGNPGLKPIGDSNPSSNNPNLVVNAVGYDKRNDAIGRIYESGSTVSDIYNMHGDCLIPRFDHGKYPYSEPYKLRLGVPEFHEEGNPTHAGGGTCFSGIQVLTSFAEKSGGNFNNTGERILIHGGGGYGGGGAGAFYRSGWSGAGGDGCVVLRYYTYK